MKNTINSKVNSLLLNVLGLNKNQNSNQINYQDIVENLVDNNKKADYGELFPLIGFFTKEEIVNLEAIIDCKINNIAIFEQATIHRSFLSVIEKFAHKKLIDENSNNESVANIFTYDWNITKENYKLIKSNERLEFLGDSVLELLTSEFLFFEYFQQLEGDLSKTRSKLVKKETLIACCQELKLDKYIKINYSAKNALDNGNLSILSDLLEATIAAIYLDSGMENARKFITSKILPFAIKNFMSEQNYKSSLLEFVQSNGKPAPTYETLEEKGPDHKKEFTVGVKIEDEMIAQGFGKSKKIAEQDAARLALIKVYKSNKLRKYIIKFIFYNYFFK